MTKGSEESFEEIVDELRLIQIPVDTHENIINTISHLKKSLIVAMKEIACLNLEIQSLKYLKEMKTGSL